MSFSDATPERILASSAERAAMSGEDLAKVLGAFRRTLISEGFPDDDPLVADLCMEFFLAMVKPDGDDDDD